MKTGLIIVDYQKDLIDGKLKTLHADTLIKRITKVIPHIDVICLTMCMSENNDKEKDDIKLSDFNYYCLKGTDGVDIHEKLIDKYPTFTRSYGDSLSAINAKLDDRSLLEFLKENKITDVFICGLHVDYSIKFTSLDIVKNGFNTYIIIDVVKSLGNLSDFTTKSISNGIGLVTSDDISFFIKAKKSKMGDKLIDPKSKTKKSKSRGNWDWEESISDRSQESVEVRQGGWEPLYYADEPALESTENVPGEDVNTNTDDVTRRIEPDYFITPRNTMGERKRRISR